MSDSLEVRRRTRVLMTIRGKLAILYVGILLLLSCNVVIRLWGDAKRGAAFEDLTRGMSRQTLMSSLQRQLGDCQRRVGLLSQTRGAPSKEELNQFNSRLDAIEQEVQQIAALTPAEDLATIDLLHSAFHNLSKSWRLFYRDVGHASAITPLGRTVMEVMLPQMQEAEKNRQSMAIAHFYEVTSVVRRITLAVFLLTAILSAVLAMVVASRFQKGLLVLKIGADTLGAGELEHRIPVLSNDELGDLAKAFNHMGEGLRSARAELHQRQRELEELTDDAQSANRAKSQFLANMSHELRTPMNAIIGYSEMLADEAEDLNLTRFVPDLKKIRTAGKQLLSLINDILDLSKIEAGKVELNYEEFDLRDIIRDVVTISEPLVSKNSNTLVVNVGGGGMYSDLTRIRQILFNLLSNACKFTQAGTVELTVTSEAAPAGDFIKFQVRDSGIGMTAGQLLRVFEAFTQADASTTRKYGGTGLGLAISKKFCEMLNGTIQVQSSPGKGTTFTVRLPKRARKEAEQVALLPSPEPESPVVHASPPPVRSSGPSIGHVLVIDDDPAVRELMESLLTREGYTVTLADSGPAGIESARTKKPDVITLDINMPGMDGWSVLTSLKNDPDLREIPIVVLTMADNKELGHTLGATEYVMKPINRERLTAILRKYSRLRHETILVVEDDKDTRDLLRSILTKDGWSVQTAENGLVALQKAAQACPGLVLLDLMMPDMDGFAFLEEFRKLPCSAGVAVIVLTAKDVTGEDQERLDGRVVRIMAKGEGMESVLKQIHSFVSPHVSSGL